MGENVVWDNFQQISDFQEKLLDALLAPGFCSRSGQPCPDMPNLEDCLQVSTSQLFKVGWETWELSSMRIKCKNSLRITTQFFVEFYHNFFHFLVFPFTEAFSQVGWHSTILLGRMFRVGGSSFRFQVYQNIICKFLLHVWILTRKKYWMFEYYLKYFTRCLNIIWNIQLNV